MKISKQLLNQAVEQQILSAEQAHRLFDFLAVQPQTAAQFSFTHVLYYFGGLIAIGAMTLFMSLGWEAFGGWGIFFISLAYAGIALKLTQHFETKNLAIPAGILATFVVALTPLAVYGLQQGMNWWPNRYVYQDYHHYVHWQWVYMQLATLAVGAAMLYRYRYPFLMLPIAVTLWYLSMDISAMIAGVRPDFELRRLVSLYFGLVIILLGFWVDIRSYRSGDYAFWLYLFGVMAFWFGLTLQSSSYELAKFGYFLINLLMIFIGAFIVRRVFVVFGAIGVTIYLGDLARGLFEDSLLFPFALTLIGLGIIYLGILWQKHELKIARTLQKQLPIPQVLQQFLANKHENI